MSTNFRFYATNLENVQRHQMGAAHDKLGTKKRLQFAYKKPEEIQKENSSAETPKYIMVKGPVYSSSERLKKIVEEAQRNRGVLKLNWSAIQND